MFIRLYLCRFFLFLSNCESLTQETTSFTTIGSIPWMAPEVIQQQDGYGRKVPKQRTWHVWRHFLCFLKHQEPQDPHFLGYASTLQVKKKSVHSVTCGLQTFKFSSRYWVLKCFKHICYCPSFNWDDQHKFDFHMFSVAKQTTNLSISEGRYLELGLCIHWNGHGGKALGQRSLWKCCFAATVAVKICWIWTSPIFKTDYTARYCK